MGRKELTGARKVSTLARAFSAGRGASPELPRPAPGSAAASQLCPTLSKSASVLREPAIYMDTDLRVHKLYEYPSHRSDSTKQALASKTTPVERLMQSSLLCWGLPRKLHDPRFLVLGIVVVDHLAGKTRLHLDGGVEDLTLFLHLSLGRG